MRTPEDAYDLLQVQRDLGIALNSTVDLCAALDCVVHAACEIRGIDCAGIYLFDPTSKSQELAAYTGISPESARAVGHLGPESPQTRFTQLGDTVYGIYTRFDAAVGSALQQEGLLGVGVLPVRHEGQLLAIMTVASRSCDEIPLGTRPALEAIASQIGRVIARIRAREALSQSEAMLRSLMEHLPDFVLMVDRESVIHFVNRSPADVSREAMLGSRGFAHLTADSQAAAQRVLHATFASGAAQSVEVQTVYDHWWSCRLVPIEKVAGEDRVMILCTDITEQKAAAAAVQKEQQLLRQLLDLHERDRQLVAYEIHDGFTQHLTAALFNLQAFRDGCSGNSEQAWNAFHTGLGLLRQSIDETRQVISGLRPPILDELGVVAAIEYLVHENRRPGGPEIEFTDHVNFDRLAPPLEGAVFRIVQQSLHNACRHSNSPCVRVTIAQHEQRVRLEIEDWGVGFDPGKVGSDHFGLRGIRERVRLLGGEIAIHSALGKGTHIVVELPVIGPAP